MLEGSNKRGGAKPKNECKSTALESARTKGKEGERGKVNTVSVQVSRRYLASSPMRQEGDQEYQEGISERVPSLRRNKSYHHIIAEDPLRVSPLAPVLRN